MKIGNSQAYTSSSESPKTAMNNPNHTDQFSQFVTNHKLNGHNYLAWSQSVLMFICGKGKDDHITGMEKPPKEEDPGYRVWKTNNSMVVMVD